MLESLQLELREMKRLVDRSTRSVKVIRSDGRGFPSIITAATAMGCSPSGITKAINTGCTIRGYRWFARCKTDHCRNRPVLRSDGEVYPSMTDAATELGVNVRSISQAANNGTKCKGFTFKKCNVFG